MEVKTPVLLGRFMGGLDLVNKIVVQDFSPFFRQKS